MASPSAASSRIEPSEMPANASPARWFHASRFSTSARDSCAPRGARPRPSRSPAPTGAVSWQSNCWSPPACGSRRCAIPSCRLQISRVAAICTSSVLIAGSVSLLERFLHERQHGLVGAAGQLLRRRETRCAIGRDELQRGERALHGAAQAVVDADVLARRGHGSDLLPGDRVGRVLALDDQHALARGLPIRLRRAPAAPTPPRIAFGHERADRRDPLLAVAVGELLDRRAVERRRRARRTPPAARPRILRIRQGRRTGPPYERCVPAILADYAPADSFPARRLNREGPWDGGDVAPSAHPHPPSPRVRATCPTSSFPPSAPARPSSCRCRR